MNASTNPTRLGSFLALSALAIAAAAGCSAQSSPDASSGSQSSTTSAASADPQCVKKACGVDCTPAGSDEPFNCNAAGKCVVTGQPLGCKTCPEFLGDCRAGDAPADLDGDGCIDGCAPTTPNAPSVCTGKVCGVDCTPAGSDEPFNCNAAGACVATGQPLGCK